MRPTPTLVALLLSCGTIGAASAQAPAADPQRDTVTAMREAGVALYSWRQGQGIEVAEAAEGWQDPASPESFDWSACPPIAHAEASRLVGKQLPRTDGRGHPLELCVRTEQLDTPRYALGVRSPGRDGVFSGTRYPVGRFDPQEQDRDVVWMDGYFLTWPQRAE
ncbi:MAG TPA: hypothetical protein VMT16_15110 [Thermoanaerobaculia bacterium]|nr:hypothetical protein [Thermoanaerobaculia bacterium]